MYYDDTPKFTQAQCREKAIRLVRKAGRDYLHGSDRFHGAVAEAQVWATLATIPDPEDHSVKAGLGPL